MRTNLLSRLFWIFIITALALLVDFAPNNRFPVLNRDVRTRLGLDLQGGAEILLAPRAGQQYTSEDIEGTAKTIERRVNGLGLSETVVQTAGGSRVIVELPGEKNPEEALAILQGTGALEYIDPQGETLLEGTPVCTNLHPRLPQARESNTIGGSGEITPTATVAPTPTPAITATGTLTDTNAPDPGCTIIYNTIADGSELDKSSVALVYDPTTNQPAVSFTFVGKSRDDIETFTSQNVGRPMSIVLDNVVISSPVIQSTIPGNGQITMGTGSYQQQQKEAEELLGLLKYGSLPVALEVESIRTVSATLGQGAVESSLIAGLIGLVAVVLFLSLYYLLPGIVASIALLIYTAVLFAIYRFMPVTLTLPGIAGFILSIGLAVDANVLIFARIKEELRIGRPLYLAVEHGFRDSWPSIRDSNVSTFITSMVLYLFGNSFGVGLIKGFALTLIIGIAVSMFSALYVTRTLLRLLVGINAFNNPRWFGVRPLKTMVMDEAPAEA